MDNNEQVLTEQQEKQKITKTIIIGVVVLVVILLVSILSITVKRNYSLHYSENSDLDYKVYLEKNDFFEEEYLGKDKQYISSLIDHVEANLNYNFEADENIALNYSYYIQASVVIDNVNGKNLYTKDEILLEKKEIDTNETNKFIIEEIINFEYDKYNKIAQSFINKFNVNLADAKLVVSLFVDVEGKHTDFDKKFQDKSVVSLIVPLDTKTTDIEMAYNLTNNNNEILQYKETIISNPVLFIVCIVLAIADIIAIAIIVCYLIKHRNKETKYKMTLNNISRIYRDYLCHTVTTETLKDMVENPNYKIIYIQDFEDVMEVSDKVNKPILYHEEIPGEEAIFYIYDDNLLYIYILNVDNIK